MATNRRNLSCSPDDVFTVLANGWLYPSWVVGASRIRDVDAGWPSPASSIHHSFGVWPVLVNDTTTVVEWDAPRHAKLKARGWPAGSAEVVIDVEPALRGCRVTLHEDAVEGPGRLVPAPVRAVMLHTRNTETLARLAYLAEGMRNQP